MDNNDPYQAEVARIALSVANVYGFALGGGQALVAHGIVQRPTEDIDLFTDADDVVPAAADAVQSALLDAGYEVAPVPSPADLSDLFDGFDLAMAEFEVCRDGREVRLTLARMDRARSLVLMEIGPVLDIGDVLGSKVAAVVGRAEVRDWVDVAAALDRYQLDELIELARSLDRGLIDEDFADAGRRLDRMSDERFLLYGLTPSQIVDLRTRLADWPRA